MWYLALGAIGCPQLRRPGTTVAGLFAFDLAALGIFAGWLQWI